MHVKRAAQHGKHRIVPWHWAWKAGDRLGLAPFLAQLSPLSGRCREMKEKTSGDSRRVDSSPTVTSRRGDITQTQGGDGRETKGDCTLNLDVMPSSTRKRMTSDI
jgi:hypothetical protein